MSPVRCLYLLSRREFALAAMRSTASETSCPSSSLLREVFLLPMLQQPSTRVRRRWEFPALVMEPCAFFSSLVLSLGTQPTQHETFLPLLKREKSPN